MQDSVRIVIREERERTVKNTYSKGGGGKITVLTISF